MAVMGQAAEGAYTAMVETAHRIVTQGIPSGTVNCLEYRTAALRVVLADLLGGFIIHEDGSIERVNQ